MLDHITLGQTPVDEDCAQVGIDDYTERAIKECRIFGKVLRKMFSKEPGTARLGIKGFPHDFGTYRELVCFFDTEDKEGCEFAFKLEEQLPLEWPEWARKELQNGCLD